MTRLAVFSTDELFHRLLWQAIGESDGIRIDLRLRSIEQFHGLSAIDALVLDRPSSDEVAAAVGQLSLDSGIVVLTDAGLVDQMTTILRQAGIPFGVLQSYTEATTVLAASQSVSAGLFVFSEPPRHTAHSDRDPLLSQSQSTELTEREQEVLLLLARGRSNAEIGSALSISENTVKYHLSALYGTLGVHRRGDAVIAAVRRSLISL